MKRFLSVAAACLLCLPFTAQSMESVSLRSSSRASSGVNFYLANNFSLSLMPGVRWQSGSWGLDSNVTVDFSGVHNASLSGLFYFNPKAITKHYVSLGGVGFFGATTDSVSLNSGDDIYVSFSRVLPTLAYGFQRGFKSGSFLFMNFGLAGPVSMEWHANESINSYTVPLPFIHIGYGF